MVAAPPETVLRRLSEAEVRFRELDEQIADPTLFDDPDAARTKLKEHGRLKPMVEGFRAYQTARGRLDEARTLLDSEEDEELRALARDELPSLERQTDEAVARLLELFVTQDEDAESDVVVEINAGVGGDEAALFAADLARMYNRFAERMGWKVEPIDLTEGKAGGYKHISFTVEGPGVYRHLRYESGGHRVQRVPATETQGRIHTSMATVVVLPQVEEVDVEIKKDEVRVDKFSAGGPGGQHVNKTESAIRLTHLPTNIVVQCQDEKSQKKNLDRAWKVLRARVADHLRAQQEAQRSDQRRSLRGRGFRNERVRTYNFPQDRITDHRIGLTVHDVAGLLEGDIMRLVERLIEHDKAEALKAL